MSFVNIQTTSSTLRPPLDSSTNSQFLKEFVVIKSINKGAYGRVYEAQKKLEKMPFAVKCIPFIDNNETSEQLTIREVEVIYMLYIKINSTILLHVNVNGVCR